jgi:hypothetical protein
MPENNTQVVGVTNPKPVKKETKVNTLKNSLFEATTKESIEDPGQQTCPNMRLLNRMKARDDAMLAGTEKFINPATHQEIYIGENGIFVMSTRGSKNYMK